MTSDEAKAAWLLENEALRQCVIDKIRADLERDLKDPRRLVRIVIS